MVSPLRAKVIAVLEQAGYQHSVDHVPTYASGGTFSVMGGEIGVTVTWQRWDATEAELGELRAGIAAALRAGRLDVHELDSKIYVMSGA